MPANLKDLRSRIKSVKSTQQITKAMKLVSAAKFGRAQASVLNARPYTYELAKLVRKLAYFVRGGCSIPLLSANNSKQALVVVVSAERGLCGGYNANVTKYAAKTCDELTKNGFQVSTVCIGKKAFQSLVRRRRLEQRTGASFEAPKHVSEDLYATQSSSLLNTGSLTLITTPFEKQYNQNVEILAEALSTLYAQQKIGKLVIVYSKFQSAMVQTPVSETVLPFAIETPEKTSENKTQTQSKEPEILGEPIFEPERDELLALALPRYMTSQIFHMLLEARASEHGARMSAMDNATRNAKEMEKKLQITYQRARQAAITNELIEIISGAEAL